MSLLKAFLSLLFPPRKDERVVSALGEAGLFARSAPASFELSGTHAVGLLPYRDETVRAFILEAKFHENESAIAALGSVLADYLMERIADETALGGKLVLIPVPLGEKRMKERGYNQMERICETAVAKLGDSVACMPGALRRVRETAPQTSLSGDQRRINMLGAFAAKNELDPSYSYIVVDDVVTTASTLLAAVDALRIGGAYQVGAIALAH